jgi:mRNA deadenylase 3'-5' endonuclease subunit Ccr4
MAALLPGARFRIMQYNVLAKRYARNMEPWFLYDGLRSEGDEDRAKAILARHAARRPDGSYAYAGWPKYAEGILTAKEIENVVRRDARDFPFERRAPRLVEVIRAADPDVFSLVECDEYEAFWRGRLEELGYGSVWHKRPRASAPDGCCLGFRECDWALDAHKTMSYDDHDRAALMGVLRRRATGERFVFVSTHLARNPESLKQQGVRLRQVAQLMRELHTFYKEQGIDLCGNQPVCRVRPTILH